MPIIKSAKKRVKIAKKATVRNAKTKRGLREAIKALQAAIKGGKADKISQALNEANSAIDTAAKKNVIHKNKAARKKRQLMSAVSKSVVKPAKKTAIKKTAVKKSVTKKPEPAKKTQDKKPIVKKTAVKKTTVKKSAK